MGKPTQAVYFINTFTPVIPIYEAIFPIMTTRSWHPSALVSRGIYRNQHAHDFFKEEVWVPSFLKNNKRWCALFFGLLAPFHLLLRPGTVNVFLTQPPLFFIPGAFISRLTKVKYVIHVMDLHPELLACSGTLSPNGITYRVLSRFALHALNHAEKIIVIGRCMEQRLLQKGIAPSKIQIVPNWALRTITPRARQHNIFRRQYRFEEKFIVLYSGNMGLPHQFTTILDAARKFEDLHDILFLFIGQGGRRQEIERAIAAGASNLLLLDFQPESMLPYSLAAADVHFLSLRPGFEGILVPSKFYGMLASGRPIIYEGNASGEIARVLEECNTGRVIEPGNAEDLYENILWYYNNRKMADDDGQKGYVAYLEKYHETISANKYVDSLINLLSEKTF